MDLKHISRRDFIGTSSTLAASVLLGSCASHGSPEQRSTQDKPNILWITCEDLSCWIGCYGDEQAHTPNIDALATQGLRYEHAYASSPVCAPARSCLITGLYATSLGTQHLRSNIRLPDTVRCFTEYLREAGYYCSNSVKKDYNFKDTNAWDESSEQAHWRANSSDKPFFSVFNIMTTHQGQLNGSDDAFYEKYGRHVPAAQRHDPERMQIPPYYPDTTEIRKMWARYYDLTTLMDRRVGEILAELDQDGLTDETIVFFFSDHGTGIPRHKRALYDTGLKVPFIVYAPKKYEHLIPEEPGQSTDQLVSFVDFAPTVLRLADLDIPTVMQGKAFLGAQAAPARNYIYAHASRVDEAYDTARCVRDKRFKYIRNFLPHLPWVQASAYPDKAEIMEALQGSRQEHALTAKQQAMWVPRAGEELFDTENDPWELKNLINSPDHQGVAQQLRQVLRAWMLELGDTGLFPEPEMHTRAKGTTPYDMVRSDRSALLEILGAAEAVAQTNASSSMLTDRLGATDPAVRYWTVVALAQMPQAEEATTAVSALLKDPNPSVRYASAGLLARQSAERTPLKVLVKGLQDPEETAALYAARELELLGGRAQAVLMEIKKARQANFNSNRSNDYKMFIDWALTESMRNCGQDTDYLMSF
jgi:N-sulfoglucosamine sulfohydrolase